MFGFGSKKPAKKLATSNDFGLDIPDIPDFADGDFGDVNVSAADLNDPDLLAELHGLINEDTPKPKAAPRSAPKPSQSAVRSAPPPPKPKAALASEELDLDKVMADIPNILNDGDVDDVVLTDADMNDPDLLAQLRAVAGADGAEDDFTDHTVEDDQLAGGKNHALTEETPVLLSEPAIKPEEVKSAFASTSSLESKLRSSDPEVLAGYVRLEKQRAVQRKRAGDQAGAIEALREAKALEERLKDVTVASAQSVKPEEHNEPIMIPPTQVEPDAREHPLNPEDPISKLSEQVGSMRIADTRSTNYSIQKLKERMAQYRQAALTSRNASELVAAKYYLSALRPIQQAAEMLETNGELPSGFVLPPHPSEASIPKPAAQESEASSKSSTPQTPTPKAPTKAQAPPRKPAIGLSDDLDFAVIAKDTALPSDASVLVSATPAADEDDIDRIAAEVLLKLEDQAGTAAQISSYYYKQNNKAMALEFHKMRKKCQTDLETLKRWASDGNNPVEGNKRRRTRNWGVKSRQVAYELERMNGDIAPDEMEVGILRAFDLVVSGGSDVDTCVGFDAGWPTADGGNDTLPEGKGETLVVKKESNPEYQFTKRIRINRTRSYQRYLERKKATFEVWHSKGGVLGSLLRLGGANKTLLGKATLKLDGLLKSCEVSQVVELMDPANVRKATGAKIEVRVRLRTPFNGPEILKRTEQWFELEPIHQGSDRKEVVQVSPNNVAQPSSLPAPARASSVPPPVDPQPSPVPAPAPSVSKDQTTSAPKPKEKSQQTPPGPQPASTTKSAKSNDDDDIDFIESRFLNPDTILSNMVLETETAHLVEQIAALKAKGGSKDAIEELVDRKAAYEMRAQLLVTLVQLGKLSMEDFVTNLKQSITEHKTLALTFKRAGRMPLAIQAMNRMKLMTSEVQAVEEMMNEPAV